MHSALITLPRSSLEQTEVFTMGRADEGQLGREAQRGATGSDEPLALPDGQAPMLIACGGLHSALVTEHGSLFVWGCSSEGQVRQPTHPAHFTATWSRSPMRAHLLRSAMARAIPSARRGVSRPCTGKGAPRRRSRAC
jgi:hypothetical protein